MNSRFVVGSDIEYTLALRDFAFEVLARILGERGKKLYAVLSSFDDVLGLFPQEIEQESLRAIAPDYVAGTTPLLILPFLSAFCEFNGKIVEDLAEITDLRINRGVPDLVDGLKKLGAHIVLITSACDTFARRSAAVLGLPHYYSSIGNPMGNTEVLLPRLKELAIEISECPIVAFNGNELVKSDENRAVIRNIGEIFLKLGNYINLGFIARAAMGGARKVLALQHAVQYASGTFGAPLKENWLHPVMYLGDSITDEFVLRAVSQGGGLAVAINGNSFALANADIAVISKNLKCLQVLAELFVDLGKVGLLEHIAGQPDHFAEMGIFVNDHNPALRILSGKVRIELKGEMAIIN